MQPDVRSELKFICPKCGSTYNYYNSTAREHVCRRCGTRWFDKADNTT